MADTVLPRRRRCRRCYAAAVTEAHPDGGPARAAAPADAGALSADAGAVPADAGAHPADAGAVPADAGVVPADAEAVSADAGAVSADAGAHPADGRAVPADAGAVPADGGAVLADAGTAPAVGEGVIDLLGLLAYAELDAFFRLTEDAALAPSLADKAALGGMAVAEFSHFERIRSELERLGADPDQAMQPFTDPVDAFHVRTAPSDWLEGLVKAYVGDGMAADFYRAVAEVLDPGPRALVLEVLADTGHAQFVVEHVRAAIAADPKVAGRLALWARRLVGEALGQAQRVAAQRPSLACLLVPAVPPGGSKQADRAEQADHADQVDHADQADRAEQADRVERAEFIEPGAGAEPAGEVSQLGEIGRMFARLTDAHARRMSALGLSA